MFKVSYFLEVLPIIASKVNITFELTIAATIICTDRGSHYCNHRLLQNSGIVSADKSVCIHYARYTGRSTVVFLLLWNCIIQCICKKYDTTYRCSGSYEF